MHLVFSVQSSLRRFKFGRGSSKLIRPMKLVAKKLTRTTCALLSQIPEGRVRNPKIDEKALIDGLGRTDVGFPGYSEYAGALMAISANAALSDLLQKKTVNGHICQQTKLNR